MATAEQCKLRGNDHFKAGQYELAAGAYSEAIRQEPGECAYWVNRCAAYRQLKMWPDALQDAMKALQLEPDNAKAHYGKVVCLQALQMLPEASRACEDALKRFPENKALAQLRAELAQQLLRYTERKQREEEKRKVEEEELANKPRPRSPSTSSTSSSSSGDVRGNPMRFKQSPPKPLEPHELPCQELCEAASNGDDGACKALLDGKADVNWQRREDKNSALHLAAEDDHIGVVRTLLAARADTQLVNAFGLTPFSLAPPQSDTYRLLVGLTKHMNEDKRLCEVRRYC
eukprot:TRINITY_DN1348_c0_g1_i1.p1 TRINITY_DN1348_c0_g1~~TRINITY_DN1348_c0_g1_i1.p1  ORF type:complete len:288 (+),score=70.07 TRINITY_DN1348_c0_g1_i1:33-896(+)